MKKNVAGQHVGFFMVAAANGVDPVTVGTPTVTYSGDDGAEQTGLGTATHRGGGKWIYAPTQAETNFDHILFTMTLATALPRDVQVYPQPSVVSANVTYWMGVPITDTDTAGYPKVTIKGGTGTGELKTNLGVAEANVEQQGGLPVNAATNGLAPVNIEAVDENTDAARILMEANQAIATFTVGVGSTVNRVIMSACDPPHTSADQFKGATLAFRKGTTTTNLRAQKATVTTSTVLNQLELDQTSGNALTDAPVSGDIGVIF